MIKGIKDRYYCMVTLTWIKFAASKWRRFLLKMGDFYLINGGQINENLRHFSTYELIQTKVTEPCYLSLRCLTMRRKEAAASRQPQYNHFYECKFFMFLASDEAGLRPVLIFMMDPTILWVGSPSVQVWSGLTQY